MIDAEDFTFLANAHAMAQDPNDIFQAVETVLSRRVGFSLLTMLMLSEDGDEVQRLYTTNPVHYPVSGRERLGSTAWGQHVLVQQKPYLGADVAGVKWAFPADFDLIVSLGLGATMNIPIICLGRTLGSMNILHAEGRYGAEHLQAAGMLAPHLAVAFLANIYPTIRK